MRIYHWDCRGMSLDKPPGGSRKQVRPFVRFCRMDSISRGPFFNAYVSTSSQPHFKELPMKIELRINGRYEIELAPESELERVMLAEMAERAIKGRPVSFVVHEENRCRVGV